SDRPAVSDIARHVASTWQVNEWSTAGQRRSTAGQRRSTTSQPPSDHQSTTAGPPFNHCQTTVQPLPDLRSTVVNDGGQTLADHRSTTARPPVKGGQRRRSTAVNGGEPPLTTVGPPPDHRRNSGLVGSTVGSGRVMDGLGRVMVRVGLPRRPLRE
ncbi:hypothetical protein Tco_1129766, partial [Tanacetum coccineum]